MTQRVPFVPGIDYRRIHGSHWWSRWKYTLIGTHEWQTSIHPPEDIRTKYVSLYTDGMLVEEHGYAIDGVTYGPDLECLMRAAFKHDGPCQLIREGKLSPCFREAADDDFRRTSIEDGFDPGWALIFWMALRRWAKLTLRRTKC